MSMEFQPPSLIGASNAFVETNPFLPPKAMARAPGSIMKYDFKSMKPKKQLKEIIAVLKPEKKSFLNQTGNTWSSLVPSSEMIHRIPGI